MIWNKFNIAITQSGLQKHLMTWYGLTMNKLKKMSEARNSQKTITARMHWVLHIEKEEIDFKSCVFIEEAGFNFHMQRTFGRSRCGTPAKTVVSNNRCINITILRRYFQRRASKLVSEQATNSNRNQDARIGGANVKILQREIEIILCVKV